MIGYTDLNKLYNITPSLQVNRKKKFSYDTINLKLNLDFNDIFVIILKGL